MEKRASERRRRDNTRFAGVSGAAEAEITQVLVAFAHGP